MANEPLNSSIGEVPDLVFEQFLREMEQAALPEELIGRFRKALIQDRATNEKGLRAALFGEDTEQ